MKENFGKQGTDKITGFTGTITGFAQYMTGCSQYCLTPKAKDGEFKDSHWFDEGKIDISNVDQIKIESVQTKEKGCDMPSPKAN